MRIIQITVKARNNREIVEETATDEFLVCVKSSPERGRSTKDALKLIARHLHVPFAKLMLTANEGQQIKTVVIQD